MMIRGYDCKPGQSGFSLIELAVVLFIISLMLGGLLMPLATQLEGRKRDQSREILEEIRESLVGYAIVNGRFPCPDCPDGALCSTGTPNDGIEDRTGSPPDMCETQVGNVPWVDLVVPEYDAWGNHFTYQVTDEYSRESNPGTTPCNGVNPDPNPSFDLCTAGNIDVFKAYAASYGSNGDVADNIPAIVISHGRNMYELVQSNQEVENYGRNPINPETGSPILSNYGSYTVTDDVFIYQDYNLMDGEVAYDDLMIWVSPIILKNRMILSGKLP